LSQFRKEILGHPAGLYILFATEMWERFSFYGMKALLIFYLTKYHLFSDENGSLLVGSYAAMVYAFPVLGGYVADRYLGFRKAVLFGGILLVLGHLGMVYEGQSATKGVDGSIVRDDFALQIFYLSLSFIIVGVGFLKSNISSIVGKLYAEQDDRRDSGFTIFYMGINLGAFIATLICGGLGEHYGWGYGFGAAGIGMLIGLIIFTMGQPLLYGEGEPRDPLLLQTKVKGFLSLENTIYLGGILSIFLCSLLVQSHTVVEIILMLAAVFSLGRIFYYFNNSSSKIEKDRLIALTVLIIASVIFWTLFEQAYTSMNLFADRVIDRNINGSETPASWFLSLNALFIILFAPIFAWVWVKLDKIQSNPNAAIKFGLGILFAGLGFGFLVMGCKGADDLGKVAPLWLVFAYMFHSWGELCLSPVGLSAVTKLSPVKIVGFMMGVWFLATAGAEYLAAVFANFANSSDGAPTEGLAAIAGYQSLYQMLFIIGLAAGGILLLFSPFLKKLMHIGATQE
jgi:proton-dependent oligopeptide transporter, POT family